MISDELHFLAPELSLLGFALLLIILDLVVKQKKILAGVTIGGLIVSIGFTVPLLSAPTIDIFYAMIAVDSYATIFTNSSDTRENIMRCCSLLRSV